MREISHVVSHLKSSDVFLGRSNRDVTCRHQVFQTLQRQTPSLPGSHAEVYGSSPCERVAATHAFALFIAFYP